MKTIKTFLAALFISAIPVAQATQVRLDGTGFDIIYDDALLGLFGAPTLIGNTLLFNPTSFTALSSGTDWDLTNSTIGLTLIADNGYTLAGASVVERGDYLRFGSGGSVMVAGQTRAYDYRTPSVETTSVIAGAGPDALTVHDLPVVTNWQATSAQTFAAGATQVHLTIENLLAANAGAGGLAFVEKKYVALTTSVVAAVPEPGQYAMLLSGLGILLGIGLRKKT